MSESKKYYDDTLPCRSPYIHKVSNLSSNMVDHAFYTIAHCTVQNKDKNYIQLDPIDVSSFNLPAKYCVVTTGYTSATRVWKAESINETVDYILSQGYTPVFLGKTVTKANDTEVIKGNFEADYNKEGTINLIDKTNILEAHAIMAGARAVVGLDNGLCPHLAGMTKTPIVVAFSSVIKEHRLPYRNDQIGWNCYPIEPIEIKCFGCQSKMVFALSSHSFTECFYEDYACLDLLSSDKFIKELQKIL